MAHLLRRQRRGQRRHAAAAPAAPQLTVNAAQQGRGELLLPQRRLRREQAVVLHQKPDDALLGHGAAQIVVADGALRGLEGAAEIQLLPLLHPPVPVDAALEGALHLHTHGLRRQPRRLGGAVGVHVPLHGVFQLT